MKTRTLQSVAQGEQQGATSGRSLSSNYAPPNLENKLLSQSCTVTHTSPLLTSTAPPPSCPSLQPSSLSSTVSSLLSDSSCSPSPISALLSTENKLLTSSSPLFSSLTATTNNSLLSTSLTSSSSLLKSICKPSPSFLCGLGGEHERCDDGDGDEEETSKVMETSFREMSVIHSEEDDLPEEEMEEDVNPILEQCGPGTDLGLTELELPFPFKEEFVMVDKEDNSLEKKLIETKYLLLNEVCCSLVNKSAAPGQTDWNSQDSVWTRIMNLAKDISVSDPQFLLKVAVYTRQELNIRITANFLLALAANLPSTKPHLRRYFPAAVQLPSDWLEVVRIYSNCFSHFLPMCLKKAMIDKFKDFSEYQLAKYNTRKHRCKHNCKSRKPKKPEAEKLKKWSDLLRSNPTVLEKFLKFDDRKSVVDKKQSEFSIKKMIKKLHIKEPAKEVMAILGKKYPSDIKQFTRSGIKGTWEPDRSGQRMRLKEPETWEHLLSREGNKASTWEKLIDSKSLPFMAMLRNLRNMITKGISEEHHIKILSKLSNKRAVIQSRQFPFRFLTAYKVIMELYSLVSESEEAPPSYKDILRCILKKIPKSARFYRQEWDNAPRKRIRVTLGVPFVYRFYQKMKKEFLKANHRFYSTDLLERYRKALEKAVQISCQHNVPPLPGRTVIMFSSDIVNYGYCPIKQDFCLPPDHEQDTDEEAAEKLLYIRWCKKNKNDVEALSPTVAEVAVLLGLMIGWRAEDFELFKDKRKLELKSDVLLENVRSVVKQMKESRYSDEVTDDLFTALSKKCQVDNIIVLCHYQLNGDAEWTINNYRTNINEKVVIVKILLDSECSDREENKESNCVTLRGFSDQLLRFVAERGSSRFLEHVEHLDKVYSIPPAEGAKSRQTITNVPIPAVPELRWRVVRVFISSTFRDMQAERDVLVHSVFPELRRRAASHCLYLQEVDLRWGVTEEDSGRAAELCLGEVCRSQMFVQILGERYGLVPPKPVLPDLPEYKWLVSAPAGLSITEMEMCQFKAFYPGTARKRMFCYFRDPKVIKSIPAAWRSEFVAESKEAESKMVSLKAWLQFSEVKITENYPCEWGGVVDGKPYLKNLEVFGRAVLEDLWTAVEQQFVEVDVVASVESNMSEQKVHQGALQRQFLGRAKLLAKAVEMVDVAQSKTGMMVVEGEPGEGKSVFMAALADALRTRRKSRENLDCDVIFYSTAASQSARSVENLLQFLVQRLRKIKGPEHVPIPNSYKDLLSEFRSTLAEENIKKPLLMLIDGVDLVRDSKAQFSSDWIPLQIPQGVCLVISLTSKTALLQTLAEKKSTLLFTLGPLSMPERREIVQKGLGTFGKKLSDSAFNNQLQTLIMKKGAVSPLYLHLACEDLRNFASFDKLKENLQGLPQSLSQLVEHSLGRLCSQHRGVLGLRWALAVLAVSPTGLREGHLYSVLNTCSGLSSQDGKVSWQEAQQLSRTPKGRIPMTTFTHIVHSLKSLIGPFHYHDNDDMLTISNPEVRKAFESFLLPSEMDRSRAHLLLAAHLWVLADQEDKGTFLHCEANSVKHLPSSLIHSGQVEVLQHLLSNFHFLYANARHGLLQHLLEAYSLFCDMPAQPQVSRDCVEECRSFLRRHANVLSNWPNLCIQQALNEPPETLANTWAQSLVEKGGIKVVELLNKAHQHQETSKQLSTFSSAPACLVVSADGQQMVVGTGQGMLHVFSTLSGQEVKLLVSSCDGISSCVFLKDGRLATTSFDGHIEVWDLENGCRTHVINGHVNAITANDLTADGKHLATVSLDSTLKVWSPIKGHEIVSLFSPGPLNCVTFDPDDHLLAAGCWNGTVIVWNWLQNKIQTSLCGHKRSVRSLCFSSSSMLCSGSVSGEVRVWSVPSSTCVGCFQAHSGATQALTFLDEGRMLLSAGSDHLVKLWSGGLGHSVKRFKADKCLEEPRGKKGKSTTSEPAALCLALHGDLVAVGYHGDGIKLFNLDTAKKVWNSDHLDVSVPCLKWVTLNPKKPDEKLLMSSGSDKRVRVWKRKAGEEGLLGALEMIGLFAGQLAVILAMEQNSTHLATASESQPIALWQLNKLPEDICSEPHDLLRGHSGGVTCLAFSPDGGRLLSGGKDKALMLWDVSVSPALLSKSLTHCHKDWITGCVWTQHCVISSSNDGRWCLWDVEAGQLLKEVSWKSPLTSVCCLGQYVIAACAEGGLNVWMWGTSTEICHIAAHNQRIHHCSVLPNPDKTEELTVFTASDDGTVQLWKPLEVENLNTFQGHSGPVCGLVCREGVPEFLTVSEDYSLRCWTWKTERTCAHKGDVSALCFSPLGDVLLVGYEFGLMEIWQHDRIVGHKQTSDCGITAICSIPDNQFAASYMKPVVDVFKLVWNQQHIAASLVKMNTYKSDVRIVRLIYCSGLLGATYNNQVVEITHNQWDTISCYSRILGFVPFDEKSMWSMGDNQGDVEIGLIVSQVEKRKRKKNFAMGPNSPFGSTFGNLTLNTSNEVKEGGIISALTINKDLVVGGDVQGNIWFIQHPEPVSNRKPAHNDRISKLRLTENTIISASYDRTVKLWDRETRKQVGMFLCGGPVVHMALNPERSTELVCADGEGKLYFLSWKEKNSDPKHTLHL